MMRSSHLRLLSLTWRRARLPLCISCGEQLLFALTPSAQAVALGALVAIIARASPTWADAWPWALLLLASYLAQQSFLLIPVMQHLYQQALEPALDEPVLRKLSRLEMPAFDDPAVHDLIARVGNPSGRAQQHVEDILRTLADWLQAIALALVIARSVWWLGPTIIALSPLLPLLSARLGRRTHAFERSLSVTQREAAYAAGLLTSRDAARELRLFGLAPHLSDRWREHVDTIDRARRRHDAEMVGRVFALNNLPHTALLFGGIVALGWGLSRHPADAGAFAAGLTALLALMRTVGFMNHTMRNLAAGGAYFDDVRHLLELPEVDSTGTRPFPEPMRQGIRFAGVGFHYRGAAAPALSDISFELRPGERLALVGANGAGKSTLIKLLLGLYRPTAGCITVDGVDLAEFSPESRSQRSPPSFRTTPSSASARRRTSDSANSTSWTISRRFAAPLSKRVQLSSSSACRTATPR